VRGRAARRRPAKKDIQDRVTVAPWSEAGPEGWPPEGDLRPVTAGYLALPMARGSLATADRYARRLAARGGEVMVVAEAQPAADRAWVEVLDAVEPSTELVKPGRPLMRMRTMRMICTTKPLTLSTTHPMMAGEPTSSDELMQLYLATDLVPADDEGRLGPDEDERLELERLPFDQAVAMADRGEIEDAKSIVGLLRVARLGE